MFATITQNPNLPRYEIKCSECKTVIGSTINMNDAKDGCCTACLPLIAAKREARGRRR